MIKSLMGAVAALALTASVAFADITLGVEAEGQWFVCTNAEILNKVMDAHEAGGFEAGYKVFIAASDQCMQLPVAAPFKPMKVLRTITDKDGTVISLIEGTNQVGKTFFVITGSKVIG